MAAGYKRHGLRWGFTSKNALSDCLGSIYNPVSAGGWETVSLRFSQAAYHLGLRIAQKRPLPAASFAFQGQMGIRYIHAKWASGTSVREHAFFPDFH